MDINSKSLFIMSPNPWGCKFSSLPDDVLLLILKFAEVMDIIRLRQTSKRMYRLSKLRWVWSTATKRLITEKGLTLAFNLDLHRLSVRHLETCAVHAVKLHENWHSDCPVPRRRIMVNVPPDGTNIIKKVFFLPGRKGEIVVAVTDRTISCWEIPLGGTERSRIVQVARIVSQVPILDVVVNEDPEHQAQIIFSHYDQDSTTGNYTLVVLHLDEFHGRLLVLRRIVVSSLAGFYLHTLRGDWLASGVMPFVVYVGRDLQPVVMPLRPNHSEYEKILAVKFVGPLVIVVGTSTTFFSLLDYGCSKTPTAKLQMVDSLRFSVREASIWVQRRREGRVVEMVTLILRCADGGFNTIKQLDWYIFCNPNPKSDDPRMVLVPGRSFTLMTAPSSCNFIVGTNGKGVFFETRTISTPAKRSYPARCLGGFELVRHNDPRDMHVCVSGSVKLRGKLQYGPPEFVECKREIYSRRCDMSEIMYKRFSMTAAALEDTVGRIALGDRHGVLEILEYA